MNRLQEIDNFIKYNAKIYEQNPNFDIRSGTIYHGLMNYGISSNDLENPDIEYMFQDWENYFNNQYLRVYESERKKYFLQFTAPNRKWGHEYKLYLSFPKDKINQCVKKIFSFINYYKLDSGSKVANMVRSDSVVLRVNNIADVYKIIDFVNSDDLIRTSALPTNPFLMRNGIVGFAYDDTLSYNATVSMILKNYFKSLRRNNQLSSASLENFSIFLGNYYNNIFSNGSGINEFCDDDDFLSRVYSTKGETLNNYEQVFRLIYFSLQEDFDISRYNKYVDECKDNNLNKFRSQYYQKKLCEELLEQYIFWAINVYGEDTAYKYLHTYMMGKVEGITRQNNFRSKFVEIGMDADIINEICNNDVKSYISEVAKKRIKPQLVSEKSTSEVILYSLVETAINHGYNKEQIKEVILRSLSGNYHLITNGSGNYRDFLTNNVTAEEYYKLCIELVLSNGYAATTRETFSDDLANVVMNSIQKQQNLDQGISY